MDLSPLNYLGSAWLLSSSHAQFMSSTSNSRPVRGEFVEKLEMKFSWQWVLGLHWSYKTNLNERLIFKFFLSSYKYVENQNDEICVLSLIECILYIVLLGSNPLHFSLSKLEKYSIIKYLEKYLKKYRWKRTTTQE
jgi:hypothetical protein